MPQPARVYHNQMIHFLRKSFSYTDNGTTVTVGTLPAGALIVKPVSGVAISTVFNGATTNAANIGPSTDTGTDLWATALSLTAITFVPLDEAVDLVVTADTIVQAAITATASATTGAGEIIIAYIPDLDQ